MAIQTRIINDLLTEIYIGGGNSWITQSAPTNFHQFWTKKVLVGGETVDDFKEVTAAEKATIEALDAKWEAPDPLLIQLVTRPAPQYVKYNYQTGFFELNGLTDVTAAQMLDIYTTYNGDSRANYNHLAPQPSEARPHVRTLMPVNTWLDSISCERFAVYSWLESVRFYTSRADRVTVTCATGFVEHCDKLRFLLCHTGLSFTHEYSFTACPALETAEIAPNNYNLSFPDSPLLSDYSVQFMVSHAVNTKPITITLHADAYARLTDELIAEAANKQITFTTPN